MTLLRTDDGMYGWLDRASGEVKWFTNPERLKLYGAASLSLSREEFKIFSREVDYALRHLSRSRDSMAEFGLMGSFMYTHNDDGFDS